MTTIENIDNFYPDTYTLKAKLKSGFRTIHIPKCLRHTVYNKALTIFFQLKQQSIATYNNYGKSLYRVFKKCQWDVNADDILIGANISAAIKKVSNEENAAYTLQQYCVFVPLRWVIRESSELFTLDELKILNDILNNTVMFYFDHSESKRTTKPSIQNRYEHLSYTNKDYLTSIRQLAFIQYEIWDRIRNLFREKCPDKYSRLKELFIENKSWLFNCFVHHTNYSSRESPIRHYKKSDIARYKICLEVLEILHEATLILNEPILTECVFSDLGMRLYHKGSRHYFVKRFNGKDNVLTLNPHVSHEFMRRMIDCQYFKKKGGDTKHIKINGHTYKNNEFSGYTNTFSPLALLLPFGPDELQFYSALVATDRHQSSNQMQIDHKDILLFNSHLTETTDESYATRVRLVTHKGRTGECEGDVISRGTSLYKVLIGLKESFKWADETGLLPEDKRFIFSTMFYDDKPVVQTFYDDSFCSKHMAYARTRAYTMLIEGTAYHDAVNNSLKNKSIFEVMKKHFNEWIKSPIFTINEITQSRIAAEVASDLASYHTKDDLSLSFDEELYDSLRIRSKIQHHSLETRLDTYYLRSNDRVKIHHINKFAALVGEQMVLSAQAIADRKLSSCELLSVNDARDAIGLGEDTHDLSAEEILVQASAMNSIITDTGFVGLENGKVIIIKSPLHAELIRRKIKHFDNQIENLLLNNHSLVPAAIAQRMLLSIIHAKFDGTIKRQGKEQYGDKKFTFAELTVTLGGL